MINLRFEQYQIREFLANDVEAIVKYANNRDVSKYMRDSFPYPYTKELGNW